MKCIWGIDGRRMNVTFNVMKCTRGIDGRRMNADLLEMVE